MLGPQSTLSLLLEKTLVKGPLDEVSGAGRRPLCACSSRSPAQGVEGPLSRGIWQDLRQAFLRVSGGRLPGQPWDRPWDRAGRWAPGPRVWCVCAQCPHLCKGAALPVQLQVVEAQRPVPPDYAGHRMWGWRARPGPGLLSAHPPNTCLIPPVGLRTFPPALSFWSRNLWGLFSPQPLAGAE